MRDYERKVRAELLFASYAPILFTSVLQGRRIYDILRKAAAVQEIRMRRITTGKLNNLIEDAVMMRQTAVGQGQGTEDLLCGTDWGCAATVLLQYQLQRIDASFLCALSGKQTERSL